MPRFYRAATAARYPGERKSPHVSQKPRDMGQPRRFLIDRVGPDAFVRRAASASPGRTNASAATSSPQGLSPILDESEGAHVRHLPDSILRGDNVKMARVFLSSPLNENWLPKSVLCLRDYDRHKFLLDLIAGVTVGLVALPLAMAFAIASGLTPQAGIYCAIVTGFLISALGGSKTQIGGPTGAFVVVVAGIVAVHGDRRPVHVHRDGGRAARHHGRHGPGHGSEIYSAAGRDRIHQRHCGADRQHADQRFLRTASRQSSGRVLAARRGAGAEFSYAVV